MAIAKNPKRNNANVIADKDQKDQEAEAFIAGASGMNSGIKSGKESSYQGSVPTPESAEAETSDENKKPITLRIDPDILKRVDRAAKRLGISRSAFIVSSAAEKLERME